MIHLRSPSRACPLQRMRDVHARKLDWVTLVVGNAAASQKRVACGLDTARCRSVTANVPKHPGANPTAASPERMLCAPAASCNTPEKSLPGGPGSPGYMASTFSTSRKLIPTARTHTTVAASCAAGDVGAHATSPDNAPRGEGTSCIATCSSYKTA